MNQIAERIYKILFKEDDGLTVQYLAERIGCPENSAEAALKKLEEHQYVINNNLMGEHVRWYVADETHNPETFLFDNNPVVETLVTPESPEAVTAVASIEPQVIIHETRSPLAKQDSVVRRFEAWLLGQPEDAKPVTNKYLFDLLGTNGSTLNKSVRQLKKEGHPVVCQRIKTHILKMDQKSVVARAKPRAQDKSLQPPPNRVLSVPKMMTETESTPRDDTLTNELRGWLIGRRKAIDPRAAQWANTLESIQTVFHEIGVPEDHSSRVNLRELNQWLMAENS